MASRSSGTSHGAQTQAPEFRVKALEIPVELCQRPLAVINGPSVCHKEQDQSKSSLKADLTLTLDVSGEGLLKSLLKLSKKRVDFRV